MSKKSGDVSQTIGFISVDSRIILVEGFFKGVGPDPVEFTETFANKSIKRRVGAFLGATFNDHVDELNLNRIN